MKNYTNINNLGKYENPPFSAVVIREGSGAPGEMSPFARELSTFGAYLNRFKPQQPLKGRSGSSRKFWKSTATCRLH